MINYVDLHVHLGATIPGYMLWEMAHRRGLKLPTKDYWKFIKSIQVKEDMAHEEYLLDKFKLSQHIQSSPWSIEKSVYYAISSAFRKCNITTIELRFNPMLRNNAGFYDLDQIIYNAVSGMNKACFVYPVKAGIILEIDKGLGDSHLINVLVDKAIKFKDNGVVGIDASGYTPNNFSIDKFIKPFKRARIAGLGTTFHTGEYGNSNLDEMNRVVEEIIPDRIGHGIMCTQDRSLMEKLVEWDITLELCPTSNLKLKVIRNEDAMFKIIRDLYEHGVNITMNTDGPVFFDTNIENEYNYLFAAIDNMNDEAKAEYIQSRHKYSFVNCTLAKDQCA